jgi:ABC-type sugar transport system ATPase subunit
VTIVVRTEGLSKHYDHTVALDGLDLEIEAGEVLGYLGPNGAGKSTTIGLLLGLIRPSSGSARIFDLDAWRDAPSIHRRLAYVPSEANLWPSLTGAEVLRFLSAIHGSVDSSYLDELVDRFELTVDKKIRAYSHGNRQKVLLIAAFASRADLVLLDEPTTDRAALVTCPERGRGGLRPSGHAARRKARGNRGARRAPWPRRAAGARDPRRPGPRLGRRSGSRQRRRRRPHRGM